MAVYYSASSAIVEPEKKYPLRKVPDNIPDIGLTPPPQCMPDEYKHDDPVQAYRNYYCGAKWSIATWKSPSVKPDWFAEPI